jgi:hypothetical protein
MGDSVFDDYGDSDAFSPVAVPVSSDLCYHHKFGVNSVANFTMCNSAHDRSNSLSDSAHPRPNSPSHSAAVVHLH